MILWILGIGVLGLYLSFIMMKKSAGRSVLVTFFGLVLLASLTLITLNDYQNFGMTEHTETKTKTIVSASPSKQLPLLLYQNIGTNGKRQVYIYKNSDQGKVAHTKADFAVTNQVRTGTGQNATLTTAHTTWRYTNSFYQTLFGNENNNIFVKQHNIFTIPKNWETLTTVQAKALAKKLQSLQKPTAAQKAQMQQAVTAQVAAARAKNPTMTAAQQAQLVKQVTAKIQQAAIKQAIAEVKQSK